MRGGMIMQMWRAGIFWIGLLIIGVAGAQELNLVRNPEFKGGAAEYQLSGDVEYRYLGDKNRDSSGWGVALQSAGRAGEVSQTIFAIDSTKGRWFRFAFR